MSGTLGNSSLTPELLSRRQVVRSLAAALPLAAFGCSRTDPNSLTVGGLAVTCNLTLPVACVAKSVANRALSGTPRFDYEYSQVQRLAGDQGILDGGAHPGRLHAGAAGHGPGGQEVSRENRLARTSLRVRSSWCARIALSTFSQLAGKRIAIPSRFAVDFLFLRRCWRRRTCASRTSRSWKWHRRICRRRSMPTPLMPTAPASLSAPPRSGRLRAAAAHDAR